MAPPGPPTGSQLGALGAPLQSKSDKPSAPAGQAMPGNCLDFLLCPQCCSVWSETFSLSSDAQNANMCLGTWGKNHFSGGQGKNGVWGPFLALKTTGQSQRTFGSPAIDEFWPTAKVETCHKPSNISNLHWKNCWILSVPFSGHVCARLFMMNTLENIAMKTLGKVVP